MEEQTHPKNLFPCSFWSVINFDRVSLRYGDGTVFHRYYTTNRDGINKRPIPTWTTSTIAHEFYGVPQTEESEATYDFNHHQDDTLLVYTLYYIRTNPGCTELDWDVISEQLNEATGVGKDPGVLKLRFNILKQLFVEWTRFVRDYPGPLHPIHDDEWWTTTCPPEFEKFRDRPMASNTVELLAQIPANFMG